MSRSNDIKRGGLADKMAAYKVEPPAEVWTNVASQVGGGKPRRLLFVLLASAAGLALALTVGVAIFDNSLGTEIASEDAAAGTNIEAERTAKSQETYNDPSVEEHSGVELSTPNATAVAKNLEVADVPGRNEGKGNGRLETHVLAVMQEELKENDALSDEVNGRTIAAVTDPGLVLPETDLTQEAGSRDGDSMSDPESDTTALGDSLPAANPIDTITMAMLHPQIAEVVLPEVKERNSKWQLGTSMTPLYSYRDAVAPDISQDRAVNNSESGRVSYAAGMVVNYLQSKRFSIESGIIYSKMGLRIGDYSGFRNVMSSSMDMMPAQASNVVNLTNSIGTITSEGSDLFVNNYGGAKSVNDYHMMSPESVQHEDANVNAFSQSLDYLEIPFNLKYKIIDQLIKVQLIGGFSTNVLVNNSISAITEDGMAVIGEMADLRAVNYSGNAGLGLVYSLMKNLNLSIEPRFRYYLNSVNSDDLPTTRPYSFGVYTGVNYIF